MTSALIFPTIISFRLWSFASSNKRICICTSVIGPKVGVPVHTMISRWGGSGDQGTLQFWECWNKRCARVGVGRNGRILRHSLSPLLSNIIFIVQGTAPNVNTLILTTGPELQDVANLIPHFSVHLCLRCGNAVHAHPLLVECQYHILGGNNMAPQHRYSVSPGTHPHWPRSVLLLIGTLRTQSRWYCVRIGIGTFRELMPAHR